jgi:molybdopterin molybdotransferase
VRGVEEHRTVVRGLLGRTPVVEVSTAEAVGRALAEDVRAPAPLPGFDSSSMDGYAVRAADVAGAAADAPVRLPVRDDIPAGRVGVHPLEPGTAQRIMTGGPLPPGSDAVVPVEATDRGLDAVLVREPRGPEAHVRRVGCDVGAGTVVLPAGTTLGPAQLGLLAALDVGTVRVHAPLRVLVVSTGSELVAPGQPAQPGQVHDANSTMLATTLRAVGAEARVAQFVADDVAEFLGLLEREAGDVDLVVTSGGVSAGAYEVVRDALGEAGGGHVEFVRTAMQPGMPQGAGRFRDAAVVCLPGNPVSAFVSCEVHLRPAVLHAQGHTVTSRPVVTLALAEPLRSPVGKRQFRRGRADLAAGTVRAQGEAASHFLGALALADCLIELDEQVGEVRSGEPVRVQLLS